MGLSERFRSRNITEAEILHQQVLNLSNLRNPYGDQIVGVYRMRDINEKSQNHLTFNYYQRGPYNLRDNTLLNFLSSFMRNSAFTELRTEHHLGYVVFAGSTSKARILGAYVCVQGNKKPPHEVDILIEQNIRHTAYKLKSLKFAEFKNAYLTKLRNEITELTDQADYESSEVLSGLEDFDHLNKTISFFE